MKRIYLFLLSFIITFALFGQEEYCNSFGKNRLDVNKHHQKVQREKGTEIKFLNSNQFYLKNAIQELQQIDSLIEYSWNGSEWILNNKSEFDFNGLGLIIEYRDYSWDESAGGWVLNDIEEYDYNEAGKLISYSDLEMDESSMNWYASWIREYSYDEKNLITQYVELQKDSPEDEWYFVWKSIYSYDASSMPESTQEYIFLNDWSLTWKSEYTYDENGNLSQYEEFNEDDNGGWANEWQEVYRYDENNRIIEFLEYEWNETIGDWDNSDRETFSYHDNNDVELLYDYNWNEPANDWELSLKEEYSYNENFSYEQLILPWFFHDDTPNYMNHQLTEYRNFNYENNEWVPYFMGNFYFSASTATSISEIGNIKVRFYPNPVSSEIVFSFDLQDDVGLQIFDMAGNMVQFQPVKSNEPVNVEQLTDGLYLFRLTGDNKKLIFSDKILVK